MIVLGLATMGNSAACLFKDGVIIAAIEEERLTRIKNDGAFPISAIKECLRIGNVNISQVNAICLYWQPWRLKTRIFGTIKKMASSPIAAVDMIKRSYHALFKASGQSLYPEETGRWVDLFFIKKIIEDNIGEYRGKIVFYDHHSTHEAYASSIRNWPTALSLSYDGGGEEDSTVLSVTHDGRHEVLKRLKWPNSLGHFYSFFTGFLGFKMLEGEYKMMGLAPYGKPIFKDKILEEILCLEKNGNYRLNTVLCDYHKARAGDFSAELCELFGPPRQPDAELSATHINIATSVQSAFEEAQKHLLIWAKRQYPDIDRLVISGGCGLNVTANGRILENGLFKEIIVPPAPHDAGCAIGAALQYLHGATANESYVSNIDVTSPYLGSFFTDSDIETAFETLKLPLPKRVGEDDLVMVVAGALADGYIVAWFQGRSEFGPRALGSRSFLADPRSDAIREEINIKIKKRELFRPFAPSVTHEACAEYFELDQESPYMNIVARVRTDKVAIIPAVTHVDGTARVHTVSAQSNRLYHRVLRAFQEKTGVPVLLNTSFNIQEPIVNRPEEAIKTFLDSDVDMLAIGGFICDRAWRKEIKDRVSQPIISKRL